MSDITEFLSGTRNIVEDIEATSFVAKVRPDGKVVISENSLRDTSFDDIVYKSPSSAETHLGAAENALDVASSVLDAAAKGTLLATAAVMGYGAIKRSPELAYKGLVIGGYVVAELKFLSWFGKLAASITVRQREALEILHDKVSSASLPR